MTSDSKASIGQDDPSARSTEPEVLPPGDRYYRHPGDIVRTVLWAVATGLMVLFIKVTTDTSAGLTTDLGQAAARLSRPARELVLALTQVVAVAIPIAIVVVLVVGRHFRRLGVVLLAALAGAAVFTLLDGALELPGRLADAVTSGTWVASTRFPGVAYVAGAAAASMVGKPWLSRPWRRAADVALITLAAAMAIAGVAGLPVLLLGLAVGATVGALLLAGMGAPNRRPSPAAVAAALQDAGLEIGSLQLERAVGGRSQLYRVSVADGRRVFIKVYGQDSRDADLLYRTYRAIVLRGPSDGWPSPSLQHDVRHEALLLLMARDAGLSCPRMEALVALADGSMVLAMSDVGGRSLASLDPDDIDTELLDAVWREVAVKERARLAHRALRAANILVADGKPVVIDFSFGNESASPRLEAIDRAELLTSLAALVGAAPAVASAARVLDPLALAGAGPYVQPLALSAATRKQASKGLLRSVRDEIATSTGLEPEPLARLIRVRPKTLLTIAALAGAFYVLLPQLAHVGDSFVAIRSAHWAWLAACIVLSAATYVFSAVGLRGGVAEHLPFGPTVESQFASSFVNRVTPANVGGMALNVRYMQKAGVDPPVAVTGMGLNVFAGGIVHIVLLVLFFAWARQRGAGFHIPGGSKLLAVIAIVLAIAGIVISTRRGRRLARKHVVGFLRRSWKSVTVVARSPIRLVLLFGGSLGVTLCYIASLAAAVEAFDGGLTFAQVGAVYLGSSLIAAAAPTPGGLGAMEAALVAGFTAIRLDPGVAVAAVLSYRLATYWLPILPGWLSFRSLERRNLI